MTGKTIRLFLVDGSADGILTAELINWSGQVSVAPRSLLPELSRRPDPRRTGVYLLIGTNPRDEFESMLYVGEGDNVLDRLNSHNRDSAKDFWTHAVVVTSKDENLTKSHVRYLESKLIGLANSAHVAHVTNGTAPPPPHLPEPDVADMDFFLNQMRLVLPVLGYDYFDPKRSKSPEIDSELQFELKAVGAAATAVPRGSDFVVLAGGTARKQATTSWDTYVGLRGRLVSSGVLKDSDDPDFYVFAKDVAFSSPSAAASVVAARNTNGRRDWRVVGSGQPYGDWQEAQIESP
jgi:hypothetical protein